MEIHCLLLFCSLMSQREGWRRATTLRKLEIPTVCAGRRLAVVPEPVRELRAGADAELPIGARQRALDRVLGDEEGRGDLAVRAALGDERRDPALGLRQLTARGRAAADPRQLASCLLGPERGAEPLEDRRAPARASRGRRRAASLAAA